MVPPVNSLTMKRRILSVYLPVSEVAGEGSFFFFQILFSQGSWSPPPSLGRGLKAKDRSSHHPFFFFRLPCILNYADLMYIL